MDAISKPRNSRSIRFDQVTVIPKLSDIHPDQVSLTTKFTKGLDVKSPFIPSPMDSVFGLDFARHALNLGMAVTLPASHKIEETFETINQILEVGQRPSDGALGILLPTELTGLDNVLRDLGSKVSFWAIDSLHVSPHKHLDALKRLKDINATVRVVSGNVVRGEDAVKLIEAGADAIRVGMTDASINRGEELVGCARSQLAAVYDCKPACENAGIPLISDGGISSIADALKAMAFGADSVMMGSLFAATFESAAETIQNGNEYFKKYQGMSVSSKISSELIPEGTTKLIRRTKPLAVAHSEWVKTLSLGISRSGCRSIPELQQHSEIELS